MNLSELTELITIRQYVINATGNPSIDKETVSYMSHALIMLDKKIISILKSEEFKSYIDYKNIKQAINDVVKITNIKSSLYK